MKDKDYIKELFSEKLSNHEVPVRSDLWSGIQSQIGNTATTAAAAKGISVAAKWAIGIASSVVVAGSVAWFALDGQTERKAEQQLSKMEQEQVSAKPSASDNEIPVAASDSKVVSQAVEAGNVSTVKDGTQHVSGVSAVQKNNGTEPDNAPLIVKPAATEIKDVVSSQPVVNKEKTVPGTTTTAATNASSVPASGKKAVTGKVKVWVDVFTPNGDRVNDTFHLETENLEDFSITVMNERNQVVFKSDNPDFVWDGTVNGEMAPEGNYVYMVVSTDSNGNQVNKMVRLILKR